MKDPVIIKTVAVIGAGSWGTSVALVVAESNPDISVVMWAYERSVVSSINKVHENSEYLPGIKLPSSVTATASLKDAVRSADVVILSTPSKVVYDVAQRMAKHIRTDAHLGFLSKGFCKVDNEILTISQALSRAVPSHKNRVIAVSGPSHAEEVSSKYHTCLNVAGTDLKARHAIAELISCEHVQCRESADVVGVELGGTLKNPAAIAAGMISILPACGDNLAGALISEALKEMIRLGKLFKVNPDTVIDISGLGDLVATALSEHSRNRRFGKDISRQIMAKEGRLRFSDRIILRFRPEMVIERLSKNLHYLAEGAYAIEPLIELASRHNIDIPVYRSLYEVLLNKKNPSLLIETIKNPQKFEELYRNTRIHVSDRKKGLETVRGQVFRSKIENRIKRYVLSGTNDLAVSLVNDLVGAARNSGYVLEAWELSLIKNVDPGKVSAAVGRLSDQYLDGIIDNYNSFFRWVYVNNRKMHFSYHPLAQGRVRLAVSGNIEKIREIHQSANLVYIPQSTTAYDFVPPIIAISKSALPSPRFYVPESAIENKRARYLVKKAGGFIVNERKFYNPVYRLTLHHYVATLLEHGVPVLFAPGSSPARNYGFSSLEFASLLQDVLYNQVEIALVPMEISRNIPDDDADNSHALSTLGTHDVKVHFREPIVLSEYTDSTAPEKNLQNVIDQVWA
ncbi:MAG TPA: NAD(P)H-dependent glycerol-3-phosphate dehydrogenase [Spirochaetota bacterium]|nr:NAD(P)H-dependent glycerol-3-phosphate dehydrogenase [Spirochaetota bacterium]HPI89165.1 NAD(P)H-dependent glycerol-3-phosphate dehydrogenase [Spirochaetota bacterium]HPR46840.1 NAD(P)H-dependent glycerol-3-phosphate dehydrogenase [Spirochaetota bacterium]